MRRMLAALGVTLLLATGLASVALAQDAGDHPAVGAWALEDGGVAIVGADGSFIASNPDGSAGLGVWEPAGDDSVNITFFVETPVEEGGAAVNVLVRSTATVSADGDSTTVVSTVELPTPDGGTTGQLGPIELTGTRMSVEAPGEPIGPFE